MSIVYPDDDENDDDGVDDDEDAQPCRWREVGGAV